MQGGGEHQDQTSGDGDAVPIVARAPVLGWEPRTSLRELDCQATDNNPSNADEGIEGANDPVPIVLQARLTKCPRSLYDLWKEFLFGFQGCKQRIGQLQRGERLF